MSLKKFFLSYYRSLIIFLLILIASTIPASEVQKVSFLNLPNLDKLVHLGMYFSFSFVLIYDTFKSRTNLSTFKIYLISAITGLIYGGLLEIAQTTLTKSRSGDFFDFLFNSIGILMAILLWIVIKKTK